MLSSEKVQVKLPDQILLLTRKSALLTICLLILSAGIIVLFVSKYQWGKATIADDTIVSQQAMVRVVGNCGVGNGRIGGSCSVDAVLPIAAENAVSDFRRGGVTGQPHVGIARNLFPPLHHPFHPGSRKNR